MEESAASAGRRRPWPVTLPERVHAIRAILAEEQQPLDIHALTRAFTRARRPDVQEIAETLVSLRQARKVDERYTVQRKSVTGELQNRSLAVAARLPGPRNHGRLARGIYGMQRLSRGTALTRGNVLWNSWKKRSVKT